MHSFRLAAGTCVHTVKTKNSLDSPIRELLASIPLCYLTQNENNTHEKRTAMEQHVQTSPLRLNPTQKQPLIPQLVFSRNEDKHIGGENGRSGALFSGLSPGRLGHLAANRAVYNGVNPRIGQRTHKEGWSR